MQCIYNHIFTTTIRVSQSDSARGYNKKFIQRDSRIGDNGGCNVYTTVNPTLIGYRCIRPQHYEGYTTALCYKLQHWITSDTLEVLQNSKLNINDAYNIKGVFYIDNNRYNSNLIISKYNQCVLIKQHAV